MDTNIPTDGFNPSTRKSVIRKFQLYSILFGIAMGVIFPIYANFFIAEWKSVVHERTFVLGCIAAGIMVGLMSYVIFRYTILVILKDLSRQFAAIAGGDGDLTVRVDCESNDEIGMLTCNFNSFVEQIRLVVVDVKNAAEQLTFSAREMSTATMSMSDNVQSQAATTEEITSTVDMLNEGVDETVTRTTTQNERLAELNDMMSELSEIVSHINSDVNETRNFTQEIAGNTETGNQSLHKLQETMNTIIQSSREMTSIIMLINEISEKINLLALNASIEAARAGDAGRGFAVVADEISKLADQTAHSLKEIGNLVTMNNSEIEKGLGHTSETVSIIEGITESVQHVSTRMDEIVTFMAKELQISKKVLQQSEVVRTMSKLIEQSTSQSTGSFAEIGKALASINEHTQSTAATSEEIAGNSNNLADMAHALDERVGYFKT